MSEKIISTQEYNDFRKFLSDEAGITLGDNKHYLVSSRLSRLMETQQFLTYSQLLESIQLSANTGLREQVIDAMTTNETMWFRDVYPFEILNNELLPELARQKKPAIKIWSAACSSGQEPYSISMTVQEFITKNPGKFPSSVEILGTDISSTMLEYCRQATYDSHAVSRGLSTERRTKFFKERLDGWQLNSDIRSRVTFKTMNLKADYRAQGKFDIIYCRNVLIYFSAEFKTEILTKMAEALNPGGYLLLGSSETPARYTSLYKMVRSSRGVIYQLAETPCRTIS